MCAKAYKAKRKRTKSVRKECDHKKRIKKRIKSVQSKSVQKAYEKRTKACKHKVCETGEENQRKESKGKTVGEKMWKAYGSSGGSNPGTAWVVSGDGTRHGGRGAPILAPGESVQKAYEKRMESVRKARAKRVVGSTSNE